MNEFPTLRGEPARLVIGRGWVWVRSGFDIFNKGMAVSVVMVLIFFGIGIVFEYQSNALKLISQLLYMVWGAGWVVAAARAYRGEQIKFGDFLAGFRHRFNQLVLGGVVMCVFLTLVTLLCVALLQEWSLLHLLTQDPATLQVTEAELQQLMLVLLIGMVLLIPMLMAVTFAPALIYFHQLGLFAALRLSFIGCWRNMFPCFWWGSLSIILLLLGAAMLLVGLLVMIPALNYSVYAAYRDIFVDEQGTQPATGRPFGFEA